MSETTASEAPEEVEKVKPAHSEKGVCKHWAQKGFCFYGADNECKFLHPVKEAPPVAAIGELESKGEDQTELLKAVKDVMTSADRGADVDAPRIKPRDMLCAAADACLPRTLELCLHYYCAARGDEGLLKTRELRLLDRVLVNRRDRSQCDVIECVRHLAAFRVAVGDNASKAKSGALGRHWVSYADRLSSEDEYETWCELMPPSKVGLLRLPFALIGHERVTLEVVNAVGRHFMVPTGAPLVMLFSGASGCGKTRLAEAIAHAIADDPLDETAWKKIACSHTNTLYEVFGLGGAYRGSEIGSPLNNFISGRNGRPGVVILDEFEKLESKAQLGFLEPWSTGTWISKKLAGAFTSECDCSKIVFVLTVNTKLPEGDNDDLIAALPFKDEIKGRITHAARFPDFSDHDIELLAASELALMQRNFHVGTGEGKIRDYTWRFGALDEHTAKGSVASIGKIKDLAKTLGCRPIKNKAHAAIADIVIDALMRVSKKKLTEKKPKALLDICYRAKGNGAPGKLVLKGVKHPK